MDAVALYVEFEDHDHHLLVKVSGDYSLQGMLQAIDGIAEQMTRSNPKRILIDVSEMSGHASISDRFKYATHAAEVLDGITKIAACAGLRQRVVRFTETVAQNRGLPLRVFRKRTEALEWLLAV